MNRQIGNGTLALAFLLAGIGTAAAAGSSAMSPTDRLDLTASEQHTLYRSVKQQKMAKATAPAGFKASVGEALPKTVAINPLPSGAIGKVPEAKSYDYAMLQNELLIVNPTDRKIAAVITR